MCGSMVDIQSAAAEIRRGKKKKKIEDRNHRAKILRRAAITSCIISRGARDRSNCVVHPLSAFSYHEHRHQSDIGTWACSTVEYF